MASSMTDYVLPTNVTHTRRSESVYVLIVGELIPRFGGQSVALSFYRSSECDHRCG